ncbi:MAG TPA: hypothetical protein VL688_10545 [Verrucomicrobiae bacterium]|jgi:hypothetical protein|nr:hypothetical protein [Verrucomicrobiae bacterium]
MSELVSAYLRVIWEERFWSWSVVGILYIIAAFTVRGWFLNGLISSARALKSKHYHEIKQAYLRRSLPGWLFFFLPLIIFTFVWNQTTGTAIPGKYLAAVILGIVSFIAAILSHVRAFAEASLSVLADLLQESEKHSSLKDY